jgi:hypothetical protein
VVGKMALETPPVVKHPVDFFTPQGEVAYPESETMGVPAVENPIMGDTIIEEPIKHEVLKGKVKISPPDTLRINPEKLIHTMGMIAPEYKLDTILRSK